MKHKSVDRSKRVSSSCRNHGSCPWCRRSRTIKTRRVAAAGGAAMRDWVPRDWQGEVASG